MMPFHDTKLFNRKTLKKPAETAKINHLDAELGNAYVRKSAGLGGGYFNLVQFTSILGRKRFPEKFLRCDAFAFSFCFPFGLSFHSLSLQASNHTYGFVQYFLPA